MPYVPYVHHKESFADLYSSLLEQRIVLLNEPITAAMAGSIVAQLLWLDSVDGADISLYINSPGGSVSDGLAIYDTMQHLRSDVSTVCVGTAASMAAVLLAGGAPGKRRILPNAEVMIHQPLGGTQGQASDILIHAQHIERTRDKLNAILAEHTGRPLKRIRQDTDRDTWLNAHEAVEYGLVDIVIEKGGVNNVEH